MRFSAPPASTYERPENVLSAEEIEVIACRIYDKFNPIWKEGSGVRVDKQECIDIVKLVLDALPKPQPSSK